MVEPLLQTILIETKEVLPSYYWKTKKQADNVLITDELRHDLNRIYGPIKFATVWTAGRNSGLSEDSSSKELYQDSPTMEFLNRLGSGVDLDTDLKY